jgi:hypothetical protein
MSICTLSAVRPNTPEKENDMPNTPKYSVLVLGGYGTFGRRICECLAKEDGIELIIAGRDISKAQQLRRQLLSDPTSSCIEALQLDINAPNFKAALSHCSARLVIHTCGPFQDQQYHVAEACIATGKHYIDLADDRDFVCNITQLNTAAKSAGVLLVSGASSVPGLSSAVIDEFIKDFALLKKVEYAISPGNKLERGFATIKSILSYTGHAFTHWHNGEWQKIYGWMDTIKQDFGHPIGERHLANINIPDLELFPQRYPTLDQVRFRAGLELPIMHNSMAVMAWLSKKRLISNWAPFTQLCLTISRWFYPFGTDTGGMHMKLSGQDKDANPLQINWTLIAENGVGPFIPTIASLLIARNLANQQETSTGAHACMGFFSLQEFMDYANQWGIYTQTHYENIDTLPVTGGHHDR